MFRLIYKLIFWKRVYILLNIENTTGMPNLEIINTNEDNPMLEFKQVDFFFFTIEINFSALLGCLMYVSILPSVKLLQYPIFRPFFNLSLNTSLPI